MSLTFPSGDRSPVAGRRNLSSSPSRDDRMVLAAGIERRERKLMYELAWRKAVAADHSAWHNYERDSSRKFEELRRGKGQVSHLAADRSLISRETVMQTLYKEIQTVLALLRDYSRGYPTISCPGSLQLYCQARLATIQRLTTNATPEHGCTFIQKL